MVNKHQIVKSGIWQLLNTAVIFISQLGYYAVMARLLTNPKEDFGRMALLNACVNFGNVVAEAGMGDALLQRKHVDPQHKNAALYYSILTASFFYLILYIAAPSIAHFFNQPILVLGLRTIGLSFILFSLGSPSINLLQKEFAFKKIFFSDSLSLLSSNVFGIILALKGYGVMSLVYSTLFYNTSKLILLWIQEPLPLRLGTTMRHWKDLFNYGIVLTFIRITNYINTSGINFLIAKVVPLRLLGVYERSARTVNLPGRYIGDIVQKISLPAMVKIDKDDELFSMFYKSLSLLHSLLIPVAVFFAIFSTPLVEILLGHRWVKDAALPISLMFLALPFQIGVRLSDGVMRVKNLLVNNLKRKIVSILLLCVLIYLGSRWKDHSLEGIALGILLTSVFNYYVMLYILRIRVFPGSWQVLLVKPFLNGLVLMLYIVAPSVVLYAGLYFITSGNIVVSFLIMCAAVGLFFGYAFFKKPKLLGKDFAPIRQVLMELAQKKKNKKKRMMMRNAEQVSDASVTALEADVKPGM